MTAHRNEDAVSEQRLSETERERLRAVCDDGRQFDEVCTEVRAILTARLAKVKALADDPEAVRRAAEAMQVAAIQHLGRDLGTVHRDEIAQAVLRAALSGDPGPEGSAG